jgi:C1A family cysteine protease
MFVYYNARLLHNDVDKDSGSFISLAMQSLKQQGVCTEETFPYDVSKVFMRPTWNAYREAFAHTLSEYYKITSTGEERHSDIKTALLARHPVVFGTPVWASIQNVGRDGMLPMPDESSSIGGHAMLLVGYDNDRQVYIVRNSWGTGWGDAGYAYMPFSYIDAAGANDFCVGTIYR